MIRTASSTAFLAALAISIDPTGSPSILSAQSPPTRDVPRPDSPIAYIDTAFENASPLHWEVDGAGRVHVFLVYDHERDSPNRANGHWHFRLEGEEGAEAVLVIHNFDNVYNGKAGLAIRERTVPRVSGDGNSWRALPAEIVEDRGAKALRFKVKLEGRDLYVAGVEPYRLSDLDAFLARIRSHPDVEIAALGNTVEGRELDIVRVGNPSASRRVLIRARAHPWEAGGNWAVEGLVGRLLQSDAAARRWRRSFCVWILPLANKDGVARGRTRFNSRGMDLNRGWGRPADPTLAPENHALERWLEGMRREGRAPDLAIDIHNDQYGGLHLSRPDGEYRERMRVLESLLRSETWFTEGSTGSGFRNPGTFGEGLLYRYGIDAVTLELNADWGAGISKAPLAEDWKRFGAGLARVLARYLEADSTGEGAPQN